TFMQPDDSVYDPCVHCGSLQLDRMDVEQDRPPNLAPAELVMKLRMNRKRAEKELGNWRRKFRFPSKDLTDANLNKRLQLIYVPAWLMDTTLQTQWAADVGFDYEVQSFKEKYKGSSWTTQEVRRTQKDWEGRAGTITLRYDNLPADAIEEENQFFPLVRLGRNADRFVADATKNTESSNGAFAADKEASSFILPSRVPADAVSEMLPVLMERAKVDAQKACRADHIRNFKWAPKILEQNWTKMMIPVWSTWYLDEDERRRMVFMHGKTGHGWGEKIPSMRRAWRVALFFFAAAFCLMMLGAVVGIISGNWGSFGGLTFVSIMLIGFPLLMVMWVSFQKGRDSQFGRF
ncbi:MAG: hypothetical protein AAF902_25695, partial [Chloroflexota bacterium]